MREKEEIKNRLPYIRLKVNKNVEIGSAFVSSLFYLTRVCVGSWVTGGPVSVLWEECRGGRCVFLSVFVGRFLGTDATGFDSPSVARQILVRTSCPYIAGCEKTLRNPNLPLRCIPPTIPTQVTATQIPR